MYVYIYIYIYIYHIYIIQIYSLAKKMRDTHLLKMGNIHFIFLFLKRFIDIPFVKTIKCVSFSLYIQYTSCLLNSYNMPALK